MTYETTDITRQHHQSSNPFIGIIAGIGATVAGTALWIFIARKYQLTWMPAVLAFGIASAIKYAGKAKKYWYGIIGAILSLITAVIGNLATAVFIVSKRGKSPIEIISELDIATSFTFLKALNGSIGLFFYAATIYIGFWFSFQHTPKKTTRTDEF